jgi:hypothetical protein
LAPLSAFLVVVMVAGVARADFVFRKKAPPADTSGEASPSGGEVGTEAAPAEGSGAPSTGSSASQAEDKDFPEAQAQRDKARADAALARQARNAQLQREQEKGTPIYAKWQFWAITGAAAVAAGLLIWGGIALGHQINGGDVRACNTSYLGCYGEGH